MGGCCTSDVQNDKNDVEMKHGEKAPPVVDQDSSKLAFNLSSLKQSGEIDEKTLRVKGGKARGSVEFYPHFRKGKKNEIKFTVAQTKGECILEVLDKEDASQFRYYIIKGQIKVGWKEVTELGDGAKEGDKVSIYCDGKQITASINGKKIGVLQESITSKDKLRPRLTITKKVKVSL